MRWTNRIARWFVRNPRIMSRKRKLGLAYNMNARGFRWMLRSRRVVQIMYPECARETYYNRLRDLHDGIADQMRRQKESYEHRAYESGFLYQGLNSLGIFGVRNTEQRFADYGLAELIGPEDRILDIGCNCGFMAVYSAFRTGCSAEGY